MYNRLPINVLAINGYQEPGLVNFAAAMSVPDISRLYSSIALGSSFVTQSELDVWYSLVSSEALALTGISVAQLTVSFSLSASLAITDAYQVRTILELASGLDVADTSVLDPNLVFNAAETLAITGIADSKLSGMLALADALAFTASLDAAVAIAIAEALDLGDALVTSSAIVVALLESLVVTSSVDTILHGAVSLLEPLVVQGAMTETLSAAVAISEAIAIESALSAAVALQIVEALSLPDTLAITSHVVLNKLEALVLGDTLASTAQLYLNPAESVAITTVVDTKAKFAIALEEGIEFVATINTPEGSYTAWVLNTETKAPWQYDNFPFNSFAFTGNSYLALTDAGLYELTGDNDDGTEIDAVIKTGLMSFGSNKQKALPRAYFGYTADGAILFKTITTREGAKKTDWYLLEERTADDMTETRVPIGRGLSSVYWQFEVSNMSGVDFDFDDIKLWPAILNRRV